MKSMFKGLCLAVILAFAAQTAEARPRVSHDFRLHGQGRDSGSPGRASAPDASLQALFARCKKLVGREFRSGRGGRQARGRAIRQFRVDACVRGGGVL